MNLRETIKTRGLKEELINEATQNVEELKAAGYNEETVEALCESYLEEGTVIDGNFTIEKLMMAVDPDQAFVEFWEGTNA